MTEQTSPRRRSRPSHCLMLAAAALWLSAATTSAGPLHRADGLGQRSQDWSASFPAQAGLVDTSEGPVQGARDGIVMSWKGIPYAAPPVGERRWRRPAMPSKHAEVLDATAFGSACPQTEPDLLGNDPPPPNEDCLFLNIWTPPIHPAAGLPVMVWIHGGGFANGSGGVALYNGAKLAERDVVVVTVNYRLGALGFLAHPAFIGEDAEHRSSAGNYGLWDQIAALQWVRANIHAFGGDPERLTIFGQSAGGVSVCALLASPLTNGLFERAIMESGNCLEDLRPLDAAHAVAYPSRQPPAIDQGKRFASDIGCGAAADIAACLRTKPVTDVVNTLPAIAGLLQQGEHYGPIQDGAVLLNPPGVGLGSLNPKAVPFMVGANADDGSVFTRQFDTATAGQYEAFIRTLYGGYADEVLTLYPTTAYSKPVEALSAVLTDSAFVCPARRSAAVYSTSVHPAFLYHFTYVTRAAAALGLGALHGAEIPFVFGNLPARMGADRIGPLLADTMQQYWTSFATTGVPDAESPAPEWPVYDPARRIGLEFSSDPKKTINYRRQKCEFWDRYAAAQALPGPTRKPPPSPTGTPATPPAPTPSAPPGEGGQRLYVPWGEK